MPLTPQITLTATLDDITGQPAGTTASPARLVIDLCNYGLTLPQIAGTATLAKIHQEFLSTGSELSIALWGNDVITPGPDVTYYMITVIDGDGNEVQSGCYQFDGESVTIDLSNAPQIYPTPPAPPDLLPRVLTVTDNFPVTFDASLGSQVSLTFVITLHQDIAAHFINLVAGTPYFVIVLQDATGGWTLDWPGNVLGGMLVNTEPLGRSQQLFVGETNGMMGATTTGATYP